MYFILKVIIKLRKNLFMVKRGLSTVALEAKQTCKLNKISNHKIWDQFDKIQNKKCGKLKHKN